MSCQAGFDPACPIQRRWSIECAVQLLMHPTGQHRSCGLGSPGTDLLVELVLAEAAVARDAGQAPALYGAKITGGGSGGEHNTHFGCLRGLSRLLSS